ncbi:MAG: GNAT family N-acetyltransferase [Oscillospiraceae bacterium]
MIYRQTAYRIYGINNAGRVMAEVTFPLDADGTVHITHTFVDDSLRDQGIAGRLMLEACTQIRREGLKVTPVCSYSVRWFKSHPEQADILAYPPIDN